MLERSDEVARQPRLEAQPVRRGQRPGEEERLRALARRLRLLITVDEINLCSEAEDGFLPNWKRSQRLKERQALLGLVEARLAG